MATSDALKRAIKKYDQEKVDRIIFRVPKGKRDMIQTHAAEQGESVSASLNRAVDETMARDLEK